MKTLITIEQVGAAAEVCAGGIRRHHSRPPIGEPIRLMGVPRGGIPAAYAVQAALEAGGTQAQVVTAAPHFIIDDILDSGKTFRRYAGQYPDIPFMVLFDKSVNELHDKWLVMPWEISDVDASADDIVTRLIQYIGDDPHRGGLEDTPKRVLAAWREWASGYGQDPAAVLKTFEDGAKGVNEMVIVHNIPVVSKCEHHLADVMGIAHVAYIPNGKIVGLSKLARLVDIYARRLQVQERMTNQIADALQENLDPIGVGVVVRCSHGCMSTRGVKIHGNSTTTSALRGAMMEPAARREFLDLCAMAEAAR